MARYFFNTNGDEQYSSNGSLNYDGIQGNVTGYDPSYSSQGMRRALLFFPTATIRATLSGLRVTGCFLSFYVNDTYYSASTVVLGTHNYTAIPDIWSASRVVSNRVQRTNTFQGQVNLFSLGTTIGTELKDGVSTGIALGPAPSNDPIYYVEIAENGDFREPVLVIDAEVANVAPNAPTLQTPSANAVVNIYDQGASFTWQHNDPDGNPQSGFRFSRRRPNGSGGYITEYWDGSNFTTTITDLAMGQLVTGALVIPALKWSSGTSWEWAVSTKDTAGLWGAYSPWRTLYASQPPVTTVTEPVASAASPRPTIRWNFSDPDGQVQYGWSAQVVEPAIYNASGYSPDNYLGQVWSASANDAATAALPGVDLRNHRTYRAYVKTASSPNPAGGLQWSPWSFVTFEIAVSPSAPNLDYPLNGSVTDLARGFTMQWRNNYYSNTGSQTAYAIRRQVEGSSTYTWWDGSSWVATEQFLAGSSPSYSFRTGEIANGQTYVFSVAIRDDYNKVSPYSSGSSVTGSTAAQVNVIDPIGVTNVTNPVITWTTYDVENDPQQTWQMKVIHSSVYANQGAGFNPLTAASVWDSTERFEENTRNVELPVNLDNGQTYRAYVRVATSGIYSGWSYTEFTVSIIPPALPTAYTAVIVDDAAIDIIIQGRDSMLSEDASRCFDGWENYDESNSAVTNAVAFGSSQSTYATRVTSTDGGTMTARTSDVYPVAPGTQYTAAASILASFGTDPVNAYVSIEFIEAGGEVVAVSSATPTSDETAIRSVTTGIAPPTAAYAGLRITYQLVPAGGAVHQFFDPVLRPTTGSEWTPGGTLNNTYASVSEVSENRKIRYGQNVPIPVDTQRVVIRDEEARMGDDMTYAVTVRAVYINAALVTPPLPLPPTRWVSGWFWISDPTRRGSQRFFGPKEFSPITRPVRQGKFRPIGRSDAIMTTGVRGLREGSFTIITHTRDDRIEFEQLSDLSEVLLLRIPPDRGDDVGTTLYVRFDGDAPEARPIQHRTPHREITQSWVEQRPPTSNFEFVPLEES